MLLNYDNMMIFLSVNATLTETRQFYTLYNTLEDQKAYMEKEVRQWRWGGGVREMTFI